MDELDTSGFYKCDGDILYAPNFVYGPTFELLREHKDEYQYPVDGWTWFDSETEANEQLN